ncbi:MAG: hypothetical protein JEZ11_07375 [Desulfobacterales bacterium]|nr:hypothetical protein [Desulfobacterales bacterium]
MYKAVFEGLRMKIIAVTLVVSLTPLLLLGIVIYRQFSGICQDRMIAHTAHVASIYTEVLDTMLRERASALQAVLGVSDPETLMAEGFLARISETLNLTRSHPGLLSLAVLDGKGAVQVSFPDPLPPIEKEMEHGMGRAVVYGRQASDVITTGNGPSRFFLTVRGRGKNTDLFLRAGFDGDMLKRQLSRARIDQVQDIYLLNRQGIFQTRPWYDGDLLEPSFLRTADFKEGDAAVHKVPRDGKNFYYAGIWLSEIDWLLVVRQASCEDLGRLAEARSTAMVSMLLGFAAILMVAVAVTHVLISRLRKSSAAADEFSLQLTQNEKLAAIGKMAAGIAHEINNPLAIIDVKAGWMKDILASQAFDAGQARDKFTAAVDAIGKAVVRASKITQNLLSYAGRMELRREDVDVNQVLNQTIDMLEQHARLQRIGIQTDFQEDLPTIASDESQIQQVFLNLLNNAIDAVGSDGFIDIITRWEGSRVGIQIADDGSGISPETQKHIFEPFFSTRKAVYGSGLGLAISYSIIKNLSGTIRVDSTEGQGTTMTVTLPVTRPDPQ